MNYAETMNLEESLPHGNYVNESTNRIANRSVICIVIFRGNIARGIEM